MPNLAVIEKLDGIAVQPKSRFMVALAQSMPQGVGLLPAALVRGAITAIKNSQVLQSCSEYSLFAAIAEIAQVGLSLDVHLGQAYLVPFGGTATVLYGYRGLCELARRSGEITEIVGEIRYAKDEWRIKLGSHRELFHTPFDGPVSKRGAILGGYAVASLLHGSPVFEYMDIEQIEKIKGAVLKRNRSGKPSPWETNEDEMIRKTPIRRLAKRLPQSPSLIPFVQTAIRDEYRQAGHAQVVSLASEVTEALEEAHIEPEAVNPPIKRKSSIKEKPAKAQDGPVTKEQIGQAWSLVADLGIESTDMAVCLKEIGHAGRLATLPADRFEDLVRALKAMKS